MKRVWNDDKFKPEIPHSEHYKIYRNERVLSKKYQSCAKSKKFNTYGEENM